MKKIAIFGAGLALGAIAGAVGTVLFGLEACYDPDFYHDDHKSTPDYKPPTPVKPLHPCPVCGIETNPNDDGTRHCPLCGRNLDAIAMQFCKEDIEFSEQTGGKAVLCGKCGKRLMRPSPNKDGVLICPGCGNEDTVKPETTEPAATQPETAESPAKTMKQRREKKMAEKKAKEAAEAESEAKAETTTDETHAGDTPATEESAADATAPSVE